MIGKLAFAFVLGAGPLLAAGDCFIEDPDFTGGVCEPGPCCVNGNCNSGVECTTAAGQKGTCKGNQIIGCYCEFGAPGGTPPGGGSGSGGIPDADLPIP